MYQLVPTHEHHDEGAGHHKHHDEGAGHHKHHHPHHHDPPPPAQSSISITPDILIEHTCMAETQLNDSTQVKNQVDELYN